MAGNIKGITIKINGDTTKLDKALSSVESNTKSVNSELRSVNSLLKFNPGNAELIAQKQEVLANQVQNTSEKLRILKDAQSQVEAQFKSGDIGEEKYRAFQREVIATESKLKNYETQLKSSASSQGQLDQALASTEKSSRSVSTALSEVNKALKLDPGNSELVAQKQQLLAQAIETTSQKLDQLKAAQSEAESAFQSGDMGADKYQQLQNEVVATESKLQSYKSELKASESAQSAYADSTKRLETLFQATGRSVDSFKDVLGSSLVSAIKNGTASTDQLNQAFSKIAQESGVAKGDVNELATALDKFDGTPEGLKSTTRELDNLSRKSDSSGSAFQSFKSKLSLGAVASLGAQAMSTLTGGIGDLVGQSVEASDAIDKFKGTMKFANIGNAEIDKVTQSVKKYADETVYDLQTVANTTAQLASNGVKNYEKLTEAAGNLNAVAGGNQDTFQSVAMTLTQTAGAGKLTTENWNQLADAIPGASGPLQEAMKKNGAYTGNFRDAMEKGEISADEFNQAVMQLGMNDGAKKAAASTSTFEGAIGDLQANIVSGIQAIIDSIGKANMTDLISKISDGVVGALKALVKTLQFVAEHSTAFKTLAVAVGVAVVAFKGFSLVMKGITLAMSANPLTLIVAGITAVVAALTYFFTQTKTGRKLWSSFVEWLKQAWKSIKQTAQVVWDAVSNAVSTAANGVKTVWNGIVEFFTNLWNSVSLVFQTAWNAISAFLGPLWQGIVTTAQTIWNGIKDFFTALWDNVKTIFQAAWDIIKTIVETAINVVKGIIKTVSDAIKGDWKAVWKDIKNIVKTVWDGIKSAVETAINVVKDVITNVWNGIKDLTSNVWNGIKDVVSNIWNGLKDAASTAFEAIKSKISGVWNKIKSITSEVWNGIKSTISDIWGGIKSGVSDAVNNVKSTVSGVWNKIKSVTSSVWNGIKDAISTPMNNAKELVRSVINKIKSFFDFKIKWPHIPLPHFKASGSANPLDWVKGKGIPSIGIDWYAKGGILTKPTVFSGNGNNLSVGGEAGPEGVIPLNKKTLGAIGQGIAEASGGSTATTINLTVYGNLDTATARKWANVMAVELQRAQKRGNLGGV